MVQLEQWSVLFFQNLNFSAVFGENIGKLVEKFNRNGKVRMKQWALKSVSWEIESQNTNVSSKKESESDSLIKNEPD